METHGRRLGLVKEKGKNRFTHIGAQLFPRVALCENVVRKTFGHVAAIVFLRHCENNFHSMTIAKTPLENKP